MSATRAPARASVLAKAKPSPREAPVTTATRPSRRKIESMTDPEQRRKKPAISEFAEACNRASLERHTQAPGDPDGHRDEHRTFLGHDLPLVPDRHASAGEGPPTAHRQRRHRPPMGNAACRAKGG